MIIILILIILLALVFRPNILKERIKIGILILIGAYVLIHLIILVSNLTDYLNNGNIKEIGYVGLIFIISFLIGNIVHNIIKNKKHL